MLLAVGTRVRLVHTGDEGTVAALLPDGLVSVRLADGVVIPVFTDALAYADGPAATAKAKARRVPGKQPPAQPEAPPLSHDIPYTILRSQGVQVAFDPVLRPDGQTSHYLITLLNDTRQAALYSITLFVKGATIWKKDGKLPGVGVSTLSELRYDDLSDHPELAVEMWPLLTSGSGPKLHKRLKVKPKVFFKSVRTAPLLNRPMPFMLLFAQLQTSVDPAPPPKQDLRSLTRTARRPTAPPSNLRQPPHELRELVNFEPVIDLHIEKLVDKVQEVPPGQILSIQLARFDAYLTQALRVGVDQVFVIHGIGTGTLRDAIHRRLSEHPHVLSFRNEYHHRYGWGATEVKF